jgi:hypothetical protein
MFWAVDYVMNKNKIMGTGVELLEYVGNTEYQANSIVIDDETKTARLIEDTDTRYTGLCIVADGKIYQFMDKVTIG